MLATINPITIWLRKKCKQKVVVAVEKTKSNNETKRQELECLPWKSKH
jgi:hypothetical protein